ncbi:TPA: ead/Ea22-like family protein [Citrobacter sedlakii]|uniref:ead/Ea22-like family protein n=1 Tax=Citrobacter sedlakii TaxID=67826 RepID=UPI003315BE8E
MSNIDKRALREAAEKATPGRVGDRIDGSGSIKYECRGYDDSLVLRTDHKNMEYGFVGDNANADELFFRLCAPDVVLALLDELETLHPFHTAFTEWHDKTEWVQTDKRFEEIKPWGKHRADVLREFIEHLESKLVAAESGFPTLTVERLMREKESLEDRVAELEEIATDYAVKFMRSQDALKHQALLHKSQMEVAEKQVEELTMWVKRLAHSLRNARPDSKLHGAAMDYLSRNGLISVEDVLR